MLFIPVRIINDISNRQRNTAANNNGSKVENIYVNGDHNDNCARLRFVVDGHVI